MIYVDHTRNEQHFVKIWNYIELYIDERHEEAFFFFLILKALYTHFLLLDSKPPPVFQTSP